MGLRKIFSFSHSVFDISKMYLVLFLIWTNALQMQLWTNAQPVSGNQCKNKLVVKNGMYDLNKDVYDLKEVWKSCAINNSGQYGRDPNSEVWKLCRSASHNLQMLCNMTIPENKLSDAKNIWQEETNHANICQDMQANVYSPQEDCEAKASSHDKEGCSVNKEVIDRIIKNDPAFCQLCPMLKLNSDINMCVVLSNIWKTLFITSDVQEGADNKALTVEKKSEALLLNGKVTNGHIPGNSFMTNTDFRSQEYNAAQGQSSSNNIYSSPLKDARELSLKAHDVSLEPMKAGEPNISGSQNNDLMTSAWPELVTETVENDDSILSSTAGNNVSADMVENDTSNKSSTAGGNVSADTVQNDTSKMGSTVGKNVSVRSTTAASKVSSSNKLPAEFDSNIPHNMDSLSAPKNDELNNRNINESSPEAAAQVSPQESKNQPSIPTNEDNKEANDVKEEEPTEMKSNEDQVNDEDTDSKQPKDIQNERVLENEDVEQTNIGDDHQDDNGSSDLAEESVKTIKDEANDKKTTIKETTVANIIKPEKIDELVQPNEDQVKEHSKPVYSKQPYDDHMDSSMEDPESSNFMSYFFVLTIVTVCGYLIFYNKKKLIALLLEGRRGRSTGRRNRSGSRSGRSSSAQYRKLDNNLEEAMGPNSSSSYREVIY